jgi:hypothetical protein
MSADIQCILSMPNLWIEQSPLADFSRAKRSAGTSKTFAERPIGSKLDISILYYLTRYNRIVWQDCLILMEYCA